MNHLYSEIFHSIQGEGMYTGVQTAWLRYYLCNLQCNGFGQKDPTDPSTYNLPYKDLDLSQFKTIEQLPVFKYGCDSSYSWSAKYKHLQKSGTAEQIVDRLIDTIRTPTNPLGSFVHPKTQNAIHMCFTGGEPLLPHSQRATNEIIRVMLEREKSSPDWMMPSKFTFETNGTQMLSTDTFQTFDMVSSELNDAQVLFSISPKLWTVSGESNVKAIRPDVISSYRELRPWIDTVIQLKFVMTDNKKAWDELDRVIESIDEQCAVDSVWVMPVGATLEGQKGLLDNDTSEQRVADEALKRGYNIASRVHVHIWGNAIGK